MSCFTCCCFYPKYKRKVDSIYPRSPEGNLVKNEIDKLQYYSCQHPEKLSKIGEYLYQNLKWGLNGRYKNQNYVRNTIEAVDRILMVIGAEYINFYANSYLKMIQKLLEQTDLDYQRMATNSFKKFCEKESSNQTANHNRNYDQFVCQFSAMCYNNNKDASVRSEIRISGLQGIGAMVKKLDPDESLQATYLWDNMDKIISALLFIMQESFNERKSAAMINQAILSTKKNSQGLSNSVSQLSQQQPLPEGDLFSKVGAYNDDITTVTMNNNESTLADKSKVIANEENIELKLLTSNGEPSSPSYESDVLNRHQQSLDPRIEAKQLLKEISSKADYITITRIVRPLLTYMDSNSAWQQLDFIECVFQTVMNHVKQQHAIIVKELIKHLDSHRNSDANMKCHIIKAISICIQVSALHSVGGTTANIIDIFTNLLKHLNFSLEKSFNQSLSELSNSNRQDEIKFQNEILEAMKDFTSQLPDYAKNDVIMFITRQINSHQFTYNELQQPPQSSNSSQLLSDQMRNKYLDALYEICTKYKSIQVFSAFNSTSFLEDILRLTIMFDSKSRCKSNEILQFLLDKYNFLTRIKRFAKKSTTNLDNSQLSTSSSAVSNSVLDLLDYDLKPIKEDIMFMRKHGRLFLSHLNESLFIKSNLKDNYQSVFTTILLFLIGINDKEFLIDLVAFGLHIQYLTFVNYKEISFSIKCEIMSFLTAYFDLITKLNTTNVSSLNQYISTIISIRRSKFYSKYLIPSYIYGQIIPSKIPSNHLSMSQSSLNRLNESLSNENDFNKEFNDISQNFIDSSLKSHQEHEDRSLEDEMIKRNASSSSISSISKSTVKDASLETTEAEKLKSIWIFDKQAIIDLLLKSGISSQRINQSLATEFSLATSYLNSKIISESYLNYRSINNLTNSNLPNTDSASASNLKNQYNSTSKQDLVKGSGSYNNHEQLNRQDSFETSYDSASQVSELDNNENNRRFFIGPQDDLSNQNPQTILQALLKQSNNSILSFDTIKRYFLNNPNITSSLSTNNILSSNNYSSVSSSNNNNTDLYNTLTQTRDYSSALDNDNNEERLKIINDYKQKSFDEIKGDMNKNGQINDNKYKQVLEFLSNEVHTTNTHKLQQQQHSFLDLLNKQQQQQQLYLKKDSVPLNDIEFPHLFMY